MTTSVANNIGMKASTAFSNLNGALGYNGGSNAILSLNNTQLVQLGRCAALGLLAQRYSTCPPHASALLACQAMYNPPDRHNAVRSPAHPLPCRCSNVTANFTAFDLVRDVRLAPNFWGGCMCLSLSPCLPQLASCMHSVTSPILPSKQ